MNFSTLADDDDDDDEKVISKTASGGRGQKRCLFGIRPYEVEH